MSLVTEEGAWGGWRERAHAAACPTVIGGLWVQAIVRVHGREGRGERENWREVSRATGIVCMTCRREREREMWPSRFAKNMRTRERLERVGVAER
jgi:hypothetical protein